LVLVGLDHLSGLWSTLYGLVLLAKLALFVIMLGFAAANRYRLTPALEDNLTQSISGLRPLRALRRSLLLETSTAFAVLGLVGLLRTLAPVSAQ
jgi:putative copper resistance protein D